MRSLLSAAKVMRTPLSIILLVGLCLGCATEEDASRTARQTGVLPFDGATSHVQVGEKIQAVVLDARERPSDSTLRAIRDLGVSHIALVTFGFQRAADDPEIRHSLDGRWYSESERGIRELAVRSRALGMDIILKPQLWIRHGAWTADIRFASEQDWETWESDYRTYLLRTARLADAVGADLLIIGTELATPIRERRAFWRALIREIRTVYTGKLTYGANWHDDFLHVDLWEELDYIGVQAYFPISSAENPTPDDLEAGWAGHLEALQRLSRKTARPVLFTEIGYRSVAYAAEEPWRWPSRDESGEPDFDLQARLYRAFFEQVWERPWFGGAILWKLYPAGRRRSRRELDFTPQGKPAEEVIRSYFGGHPGAE